MLKILHTSDWHLGHSLYNNDRTPEQQSMLEQVRDIIGERRPDALLVSGDIFDTSQPSAAVQRMFVDALVSMRDVSPSTTIIVTAGNHDSGVRHEVYREPLARLGVYMIGGIDRENPASHIIDIDGRGFVLAVPYCHERNLPDDFYSNLLAAVAERNTGGLPVVMMAHTTVQGADFSGHSAPADRDLFVGGIDATPIDALGTGYDYLALGHIHREQWVHSNNGHHRVRYSGTPLAVSFDEQYAHSVTWLTIGGHGDTPEAELLAIDNPRPLVSLPVEGFADWDTALDLLKKYPADIAAYIRLNVEVKDFLPPDAYNEALRVTADKQCTLCFINARRSAATQTEHPRTMTIAELKQQRPIDLARRYAATQKIDFDDTLSTLFEEAQQSLENDNH